MNPIIKNVLGFVLGAFGAVMLNGLIIRIGGSIIPPPPGTNLSTPEGIKAAMPLLEARHFLFPFIAHALGSLAGAFIGSMLSASYRLIIALVIGGLHMVGGVMMVMMVPAPMWFNILDLGMAYLPMAWLGWKIAESIRK